MFDEFIEFEANNLLITDFSFEFFVDDGGLHLGVKGFDHFFAPFFCEVAGIEILVKMFGGDLTIIDEIKQHPIPINRFEDFCNIESQGKPPVERFMEITDGWMKLSSVDFFDHSGIHETVDKRDEGIHGVVRWMFHPLLKFHGVLGDEREGAIVTVSGVAFDSHE